MFDVRITEIATGSVTNYFDETEAFLQEMRAALHPDLFTIKHWLSHPDWASRGCMACGQPDKYDEHIHEGFKT